MTSTDGVVRPGGGASSPTGSIFDIGYRGYDGPRLGRRHAVAALFRHSLRSVFGIGRPARAKILPLVCLAIPALIATVIVGMSALIARLGRGAQIPNLPGHAELFGLVGAFVTILVAAQAPELLGRDVRYRVLTLYFSRALLRVDYALARLAALATAVAAVLLLPHAILSLGAILLTPDVSGALGRELGYWPAILGSTLVNAFVPAALALALAGLIVRRAYATAAIFGVFIVPGIVAAIIVALDLGSASRQIVLLDIGAVLDGANAWFFGVAATNRALVASEVATWETLVTAIIAGAGAAAVLVQRYRTVAA
jgi:ABC-2 type transport system permease protein